MFCKIKKTFKEYREFQMKMYTRIADKLERRLAAVIAAKQKLAEQIDRDNQIIEDSEDVDPVTPTVPTELIFNQYSIEVTADRVNYQEGEFITYTITSDGIPNNTVMGLSLIHI